MLKKLKGITLLETMLVLAIATSIALLMIQNYVRYKRDRDAFALKYNVDMLFQAMRNYYYANCRNTTTLAPSDPASGHIEPVDPFPIDTTTLGSYLDASWHPENALIDRSFGNSGYAMQFNKWTVTGARTENFCYYSPGMGATPSCYTDVNPSSQIYYWIAQIVVQVRDTNLTLALRGLTSADCAIQNYSAAAPSIVDCLADGVTTGNPAYLVWQRLPSVTSPTSGRDVTSTVKQFNLQYTNDSLAELVSATYAGTQYYLCGG